jgi:hypothetical protein
MSQNLFSNGQIFASALIVRQDARLDFLQVSDKIKEKSQHVKIVAMCSGCCLTGHDILSTNDRVEQCFL